ncbi:MAG: lipoyl(octanoyl) transferase LipB [Cyclobacteriaceae bacterium]|nr:lipoyl(octanoyl) transferase LipB [Cyclobacteriaceae bacterium]
MNTIQNHKVEIQHLGLKDYQEAWSYQEDLFRSVVDLKLTNRNLPPEQQHETPNRLLFVEHPHVYTLGKSGSEANLLLNEQELKEKEATYYKINRGGDITYHGPGQLVCYPIIDLDNFFTDIHKYLRLLEEAVILTLAEYGIVGGRMEKFTGVWIDFDKENHSEDSGGCQYWNPRKICAIGVKTSRWVTMHGLALNVNTDLSYFGNIIPCGIDDKAVTSIAKELGKPVDMQEAQTKLKNHLIKLLGMEEVKP